MNIINFGLNGTKRILPTTNLVLCNRLKVINRNSEREKDMFGLFDCKYISCV